jgi:hypothetical protein
MFGGQRRTESKDLFDIISILDAKLVSNEVAREIFQQFDAQI